MLQKVLLWMMLLSCTIHNVHSVDTVNLKYEFLVLEQGQSVTNRGIFFNESIVPNLLYDLSILPILKELKATYEKKTTIDNERIVLRDSVITNYITKVEIQYKLDKAKKKKAIIVTAIASALSTAGIILGLDIWISSLK